jgi:hypothetical protein
VLSRNERHGVRRLEVREPLADEVDQLLIGGRRSGLQHDECVRRLSPLLMLDADNPDLLHRRMPHQRSFDFD